MSGKVVVLHPILSYPILFYLGMVFHMLGISFPHRDR